MCSLRTHCMYPALRLPSTVAKLSSTHMQPMHARCTHIQSDKTTLIHKVRLMEAVSSLGNRPRFVSQIRAVADLAGWHSTCNISNFCFGSIQVIPLFCYSVISYSAVYSVPVLVSIYKCSVVTINKCAYVQWLLLTNFHMFSGTINKCSYVQWLLLTNVHMFSGYY